MAAGLRWAATIAAVATLPLGAAAPQPQQDPTVYDADIVVIARKLRKVRINYVMRGSWVRSCTAEISSGDERIDRIMCGILRACVKAGHAEVDAAKACIAGRIDSLDAAAEAALLANPGARIAAVPPPPPAARPQRSAPTDSDIVVTAQIEPDIVVTGDRPTMRGGLWQFNRTATMSFGGGPVAGRLNFTQCLPPGAIEAMLRRASGEGMLAPASARCSRMTMKFGDGRLSGSRICTRSGLDPNNIGMTEATSDRLDLSGRYDARSLSLTYIVEQDHDGIERGGGAGWSGGKRQVGYRWLVTAKRIGECPLKERRDQVDALEAVSALFAKEGLDDLWGNASQR
ncbi:hypothetical protein [Sphingomonas sp. VNH70]|uniref:hypothetical protein n=1 Tax=Sphingomonas silueang TaxID=3156617 RepID=UPI0032B53688